MEPQVVPARPGELPDAPPWRGGKRRAGAEPPPALTVDYVRRSAIQALAVAAMFFGLCAFAAAARSGATEWLAAAWLSLCAGASVVPPLWARAWASEREWPQTRRVLLAAAVFLPCGLFTASQGFYTVLRYAKSQQTAWDVVVSVDFLVPLFIALVPASLLVGVAIANERRETSALRWLGLSTALVGVIAFLLGRGDPILGVTAAFFAALLGAVLMAGLVVALDIGLAIDRGLFGAR
ncbi:MAG: hypothetical protein AB7N76_32205 [Planctomycetota bacterium]